MLKNIVGSGQRSRDREDREQMRVARRFEEQLEMLVTPAEVEKQLRGAGTTVGTPAPASSVGTLAPSHIMSYEMFHMYTLAGLSFQEMMAFERVGCGPVPSTTAPNIGGHCPAHGSKAGASTPAAGLGTLLSRVICTPQTKACTTQAQAHDTQTRGCK